MFQSWSAQVVGFCNCNGLNGLIVVRWKPIAALATSSGGNTASKQAPCRARASRHSASTTPDSAKPTMTMDITQ